MYREYIENTHSEYSSSISDLNSYIVSTCCREDLFGRLPFFDRIFFTGQFLKMLGDFYMTRGMFTVDKLFRCVYLSWAIHLDRFSKEYEPSVRYKGTETFDELWKIFRFKSFVTNIDNIREIENLEKFRQLPGILTNIRRLCDSDPSQLVDPMSECSESLHSVEKTEGVSHAAREVCQNTIPTPTDFQSSGSRNDTSEVKLNNQKDIPNASKRNYPQYAKVNDVNPQHSENKASRSDKNQTHQECSLKLSNLDLNNYRAALPSTTTKVSKNHLENVEQNMEDSEKMDDFCVGSSSTTPCLAGEVRLAIVRLQNTLQVSTKRNRKKKAKATMSKIC
ncbi:hypothetical protein CEXT_65281 [Caerostris extrusa]|uniref:Uncharacterized protein n=1 Tax=Caerostris extrusa TaxID=172846 RepID=A0AAV4UVI1_CAEEX|nr:hypothetical protein CEXT_65281 [Caerostris extrusa]